MFSGRACRCSPAGVPMDANPRSILGYSCVVPLFTIAFVVSFPALVLTDERRDLVDGHQVPSGELAVSSLALCLIEQALLLVQERMTEIQQHKACLFERPIPFGRVLRARPSIRI